MKYEANTLNKAKENLENIIKCIEAMETGVEESIACSRYGIREHQLRQILFNNSKSITYVPEPEEQIYQHLFGIQQNFAAFPVDLKETIPYIMQEYLTEEERNILHKMYWEGNSYVKIAKEYNMKVAAIRQIERNAIAKLKEEKPKYIVEYGIEYLTQLQMIRKKITDEKRKENIQNYINEYIERQDELFSNLKQKIDLMRDNIVKDITDEIPERIIE